MPTIIVILTSHLCNAQLDTFIYLVRNQGRARLTKIESSRYI